MSCCPVRYLPVTQGDRLRKPSVEISILCAQVHLPVGRKLQKFWCILDWDTPWIFRYFSQTHKNTSGFSPRMCAQRCAHLSFWAQYHAKRSPKQLRCPFLHHILCILLYEDLSIVHPPAKERFATPKICARGACTEGEYPTPAPSRSTAIIQ